MGEIMKFKIDKKAIATMIEKRTAEIEIGGVYFLSSFYDKSGCYVRVLKKELNKDAVGWVKGGAWETTVESIEEVGDNPGDFYAVGKIIVVGAQNLYDKREDASAKAKWGRNFG